MYVCYKNMKIKQKEWQPATKPLKTFLGLFSGDANQCFAFYVVNKSMPVHYGVQLGEQPHNPRTLQVPRTSLFFILKRQANEISNSEISQDWIFLSHLLGF